MRTAILQKWSNNDQTTNDKIYLYRNLDWKGLSYNPSITGEIIEENIDMPLNWSALDKNKNLSWDIVKKHYKTMALVLFERESEHYF